MKEMDFIANALRHLYKPVRVISYRMGNPLKWLPKVVYFSVNSVCNMKFKMCDIGQRKREFQFAKNLNSSQNIELLLPLFKRIIDEISSFQPSISIVATEPLLYSEIVPASRYVKEKGLGLSITTNGLMLEKFAESLVEMGLDDLWISMDGTRELNDSIRGVRGAFDCAMRGIDRIHILKQELKAEKPKVHINFTISDLNCTNLFDFLEETRNGKIDFIQFSHLNFVTEEMAQEHNRQYNYLCVCKPSSISRVDPRKVDLESLYKQIGKIKRLFSKSEVTFTPNLRKRSSLYDYYLRPDLIVGKKRCMVPWTSASIQPSGDMVVLARCLNYVLGNVGEQSLLEIWSGGEYQSFRKELWQNRYFPACTRCCGIL